MKRLIVALAVLLVMWLAVVVRLAAGAYGAGQPPACVVLHVAATPFSPAYPLTVCGTHLTGRWRCEPASLMHGLALACERPAESNAGSRRRVNIEEAGGIRLPGRPPAG